MAGGESQCQLPREDARYTAIRFSYRVQCHDPIRQTAHGDRRGAQRQRIAPGTASRADCVLAAIGSRVSVKYLSETHDAMSMSIFNQS